MGHECGSNAALRGAICGIWGVPVEDPGGSLALTWSSVEVPVLRTALRCRGERTEPRGGLRCGASGAGEARGRARPWREGGRGARPVRAPFNGCGAGVDAPLDGAGDLGYARRYRESSSGNCRAIRCSSLLMLLRESIAAWWISHHLPLV